jgi:hypothetical protein
MLSKNCIVCNKEFFKLQTRSLKSWKEAKLCSHECYYISKIGISVSPRSEFKKGFVPWNTGKIGVQVSSRKGKKYPELSGENSKKWKGTDDKYYRKKTLKRDDHTCRQCGLKDLEIMVVDHIKPKGKFPELRHMLDNLQTLCPNCHARKTIKELKQKRS